MAGGYTPAFASLYTGTLYGKWPTAPVWASLLPLIDSHGHIEMTHEAISGMTGWPIDLLRLGIAELEKPDLGSRSPAEEGCRLVRLDPARSWGWRVVNVQKYRERARDHSRVADGRNAEKLRNWRASKRNPVKPDDTRGNRATLNSDSDSDSNADSDKSKNKNPPTLRSGGGGARKSNLVPDEFTLTAEIREWSVTENPELDPETEFAKFHDHEFREPHSDWLRAWRRWVREGKKRGDFAKKPDPNVQLFAGKPVKWQ